MPGKLCGARHDVAPFLRGRPVRQDDHVRNLVGGAVNAK